MNLQRLHIKNFKSIVDLEIIEPNPFTVFVGPNGSGKSNIFEALELAHMIGNTSEYEIENILGGKESYLNRNLMSDKVYLIFNVGGINYSYNFPNIVTTTFPVFTPTPSPTPSLTPTHIEEIETDLVKEKKYFSFVQWIILNFTNLRSSVSNASNSKKREYKFYQSSSKLDSSASNLEKVLKRILQDANKREEILEVLQLLVPELENIEVYSDNISGQDTILIKEKHSSKPFGKSLISDGTYNILCLLTAIYQSDEPQFLCIEEPENGLSPYAIELLVELMRNKCKEEGHYIWLNTHSATLVRQLRADELILVDKENGATQVKQFEGKDFHGLRMDEAWLTNALGGGLPW